MLTTGCRILHSINSPSELYMSDTYHVWLTSKLCKTREVRGWGEGRGERGKWKAKGVCECVKEMQLSHMPLIASWMENHILILLWIKWSSLPTHPPTQRGCLLPCCYSQKSYIENLNSTTKLKCFYEISNSHKFNPRFEENSPFFHTWFNQVGSQK